MSIEITTQQKRFWSPLVRELEPYVPGEQPKIQDLLKLNTNENPYPPSPKVVEAVQSVIANQADVLKLYPDPDANVLKQAIAKQQGVAVGNVFVGNGSDEVLAHIFKAFFVQDKPLLYPDISYSFYPVYSQFFGLNTIEVPLTDTFEIDVEDYRQANGGLNGGIIITNVVVIDEAYVDFGAESAVSLVAEFENLVVCQTTSKSRSLAGLRVGYAIAQPHLITALESVKNSFNSYPIDRFALACAVASFEDQPYFEAQCEKVIASREQLIAEMQMLDFKVLPSKANFIFATHGTVSAAPIAQKLREQGVIVRYFNRPRIDNYLRITVGTDEQNQRLIDSLKTFL